MYESLAQCSTVVMDGQPSSLSLRNLLLLLHSLQCRIYEAFFGQEILEAYILASREYQKCEKEHDEDAKSDHFTESSEVLS